MAEPYRLNNFYVLGFAGPEDDERIHYRPSSARDLQTPETLAAILGVLHSELLGSTAPLWLRDDLVYVEECATFEDAHERACDYNDREDRL